MDGSLSRFCHKISSESTGVKGIEWILRLSDRRTNNCPISSCKCFNFSRYKGESYFLVSIRPLGAK